MNSIYLNTKQVGYILVVVALILGVIIFQYTDAINVRNNLLHSDCNLPESICPFKPGISGESIIGVLLTLFILALGVFLIYTYKDVRSVLRKKNEKLEGIAKTLEKDEKTVYKLIMESDGAIYQHDLITKSEMTKVKMTRILDFLEARGLVERKRRGMSNLVVLKDI